LTRNGYHLEVACHCTSLCLGLRVGVRPPTVTSCYVTLRYFTLPVVTVPSRPLPCSAVEPNCYVQSCRGYVSATLTFACILGTALTSDRH